MVEKFRGRETNQGKRIAYQTHGESTNDMHPAFCLRYLDNSEYGIPKNDKDKQVIILKEIYQYCQQPWRDIIQTPRDRGGGEPIAKNSITKMPRMDMSPDERYLSFYIGGKKGRMVGCRRGKVFYVFWFDFTFTLYKH
jgi:hypothetical protein